MKRLLLTFFFLYNMNPCYGLEEDYFQRENFQSPKRDVSIIASPEGYYPAKLVVFEGEEVQIFVTGSKNTPSCLIIEGTDIFLPANAGVISEGSIKFKKVGTYRYYCPQGKIEGKITVLEHPELKRQREMKRQIASKRQRVKIWRPKDGEEINWNE